jgi:hypothetical protein
VLDFVSTIVAALIGSIIGAVGAVFTDHWLTGRSEKLHRREILIQRYLFQLQDALEMLGYRLENLVVQGGRSVMSKEYFQTTTLYAFGRVLAMERIFALEAVYPQLDAIYPTLGKHLMEREYRIDLQLPSRFYQYDRIALAEAVIVHEGDVFRTRTYLEFRQMYEAENSQEKQWLESASAAIQRLSDEQGKHLLHIIYKKSAVIAKAANISNSFLESRKVYEVPS